SSGAPPAPPTGASGAEPHHSSSDLPADRQGSPGPDFSADVSGASAGRFGEPDRSAAADVQRPLSTGDASPSTDSGGLSMVRSGEAKPQDSPDSRANDPETPNGEQSGTLGSAEHGMSASHTTPGDSSYRSYPPPSELHGLPPEDPPDAAADVTQAPAA